MFKLSDFVTSSFIVEGGFIPHFPPENMYCQNTLVEKVHSRLCSYDLNHSHVCFHLECILIISNKYYLHKFVHGYLVTWKDKKLKWICNKCSEEYFNNKLLTILLASYFHIVYFIGNGRHKYMEYPRNFCPPEDIKLIYY